MLSQLREISLLFISFCLAVILGMSLVWVNIERVDLAYDLQKMQTALSQKQELASKLELERNNLVSPARLRHFADRTGLHPAGQGQMRTIASPSNLQPRND